MEAASQGLAKKFEAARKLFERALVNNLETPSMWELQNSLDALETRFALSTSHLYIKLMRQESERMMAQSEFARILASEDFAGEVDRLVLRAEAALRRGGLALRGEEAAPKPKRSTPARRGAGAAAPAKKEPASAACIEIQRLLDAYPKSGARAPSAAGGVQRIDYEKCPTCGVAMSVDTSRSELRCGECGTLRELVGMVFEDSQFYSQEGQKAKSGTFNPNRHFQLWWTHLFALEPEEEIGDKDDPDNQYGEKVMDALREIVTRDRKILQRQTVNDVRAMLREINRTDLNKNTSLILKKLTGIGPPQPSDELAARTENIFTKTIEAGERLRRADRVNRNYYPFNIMKILEELIPADDYESRRIFYYIYIQSKETVEADDADWELICRDVPELTYRPTDRRLGQKYPPL
jgi:hypothetical protein